MQRGGQVPGGDGTRLRARAIGWIQALLRTTVADGIEDERRHVLRGRHLHGRPGFLEGSRDAHAYRALGAP